MCGIAGIASLNAKAVPPDALVRMCHLLAHRGPDDAGHVFFHVGRRAKNESSYWVEFTEAPFKHLTERLPVVDGDYYRQEMSRTPFQLGLGHRRLSIIDLTSHGHQPMASPDRRCWITYNGEIYNFREIRQELLAQGHLFRTQSDTESILHLWEAQGLDGLLRLDGMFAFALYDRKENLLTLARDRFGVKPLYYAFTSEYLLFASEPKAILASGLLAPTLNPARVVEYFAFQNGLTRETLFDHICLLQPGEYLQLNVGRKQHPAPRRFHGAFPRSEPGLASDKHLTDRVADAFCSAVKRQLVSDVEVGAYLSGGMDSGSIVAVSGRAIPRLLTFTCGFDLTNVNGIEQGFDERDLAQKLSHLLQTEHYDVVLHAGDMPAAMERLTWHMDDPRVGMCHQNWYAAKLASRFVKVCLAGAGGDELFGGYPWRYRQGLEANSISDFDQRYLKYWHRLLAPNELAHLFDPSLHGFLDLVPASFAQVMNGAPCFSDELSIEENLLDRALYFEFKTFLHGFLVTEDHISMAHSLETRVPFLDNELADLAFRIPPSLKVASSTGRNSATAGHLLTADGKLILRQAMEHFLPREFTQQRKQGFSPPDENWYRGPSMDYIKEILWDDRTRRRGWFDQAYVTQRMAEHFEGRQNHRLLIWSLLSIEWLQRHYLDHGCNPLPDRAQDVQLRPCR
jgi:asparagine synthase (glutamine-hydrolysing)